MKELDKQLKGDRALTLVEGTGGHEECEQLLLKLSAGQQGDHDAQGTHSRPRKASRPRETELADQLIVVRADMETAHAATARGTQRWNIRESSAGCRRKKLCCNESRCS